jgi:FkbM family methyltransferase
MLRRAAADFVEWLPRSVRQSIKARHFGKLLARDLAALDPDLRATNRLVGSGDNVLDVGANVGVWTHHLSNLVGPTGFVWSFEPVPETCALLRLNIARFRLANAVAIERAVSDSDAILQMSVPRDARGILNHHLARIEAAPDLTSFLVQSTRLDSWFALTGEPRVSFVKIDTEGHELGCIRGMLRLLSRCYPALCVEVSFDLDDPGSDGSLLERELQEHHYRAYLWTGESFRLRRKSERTTNYFFLRDEHLRGPEQGAGR